MQPPALQQIIDAAVPLFITLVGLLFTWLTTTIRSKIRSEQARGVLLRLSEQARDVVLELEQTIASDLRAMAKDGVLDDDEIAELRRSALVNFRAYLGERGRADAIRVLGFRDEAELEAVLRAKLEAEVARMKSALEHKAAA